MRKLPAMVALLFTLTIASSALAAGYGAAGCGLGGMLIKENKILHQIGAWILNMVLGNQTFGITSGTSECGSSKSVSAEKEQTLFVENNYQNLAKEMAAGEGEALTALAGLLGCPTDQSGTFAAFTKENYASIFVSGEATPADMLASLKKEVSNEPVLASSCHRI